MLKFGRPKESTDYPAIRGLADHVNSSPFWAEEIVFSRPEKQKDERHEVRESASWEPTEETSRSEEPREGEDNHKLGTSKESREVDISCLGSKNVALGKEASCDTSTLAPEAGGSSESTGEGEGRPRMGRRLN